MGGINMSGGSYEYLYCKEGEEIFNYSCKEWLEKMADDLAKLGYADDAAKETMDLLLTIRAAQNRIESMKRRLNPVFHAMKWWQSCDSSEETFKNELKKYRGET
jgi:hypothetical protein